MKHEENIKTVLAEERTLLAAERTFSAWIRTALAAMAGGLAILRLLIFKSELHRIIAHLVGEMLMLWGCLIIILAALDYKKTGLNLALAKNYKNSQTGFLIIVAPIVLTSALLIWVTLP